MGGANEWAGCFNMVHWGFHVEKPRPFISPPIPYMVMLQDFLWEIYGIFLKFL